MIENINIKGKKYEINIVDVAQQQQQQQQLQQNQNDGKDRSRSNNDSYVGQWQEKPGTISQGETIEELLSNMVDAIQLMQEEIGRQPSGFWIKKTIDKEKEYPPNSWQECVKLLESSGYRLVLETNKHKKFRSPTIGGRKGWNSSSSFIGGGGGGGITITTGGLAGDSGITTVTGSGGGGAILAVTSSVIVPVQTNINSLILDYYRKHIGKDGRNGNKSGEGGLSKFFSMKHKSNSGTGVS